MENVHFSTKLGFGAVVALTLTACSEPVPTQATPQKRTQNLNTEPMSGLSKTGLIAVQNFGTQWGIIFDKNTQSKDELRIAAARLCKRIGLTRQSNETTDVSNPDAFPPNTKFHSVKCG